MAALRVAAVIFEFLSAVSLTEMRAAIFEQDESPRVQEARKDNLGRLDESGLDEAVREGVTQWDNRGAVPRASY